MRAGYSEETEHKERVPEIFMGSPFDIKLPSNEQSMKIYIYIHVLSAIRVTSDMQMTPPLWHKAKMN